MSGFKFTIDIEDHEIDHGMEMLVGKMENLAAFHKSVGEHMLNSTEDRFDTETAPDGTAWAHHAPATIASRLRRNGNAELTILRESGALAGSFNYEAGDAQVEIGTPTIYAAIHHFGGSAGRNQSVDIPARPILGISSDDEIALAEMAEDFLSE